MDPDLDPDPHGSALGIRIRIQEGQNWPKKVLVFKSLDLDPDPNLDPDPFPDPHWQKCRIRIRIETNADPQRKDLYRIGLQVCRLTDCFFLDSVGAVYRLLMDWFIQIFLPEQIVIRIMFTLYFVKYSLSLFSIPSTFILNKSSVYWWIGLYRWSLNISSVDWRIVLFKLSLNILSID